MKLIKVFSAALTLLFILPGFASAADDQYRCIITDFSNKVLLDDVMTLSQVPQSPAQHLETYVKAKASDGSMRTLSIAVWMSRPFTPGMVGMSFGVRDLNDSQDDHQWLRGPSVATYIEDLKRVHLFLTGVIPLDQGRVVHIHYTVDCRLKK